MNKKTIIIGIIVFVLLIGLLVVYKKMEGDKMITGKMERRFSGLLVNIDKAYDLCLAEINKRENTNILI